MRALLLNSVCFLFSLSLWAQANWEYTITDLNHSILIPATLAGIEMELGDELGVFYEIDGELVCGGSCIWTGDNTSIAAYGASWGQSGFQNGEFFKWKYWSVSSQTEISVWAEYNTELFPNAAFFISDGMSGITQIGFSVIEGCSDVNATNFNELANSDDGTCIYYQDLYEAIFDSISQSQIANELLISDLELQLSSMEGFNDSISMLNTSYLDSILIIENYYSSLLESQFTSLDDSITILHDDFQQELTNQEIYYSDSISDLISAYAYELDYFTSPILLNLNSSWNMIGYPLLEAQDAVVCFSPITDSIQIVKNNDGVVYWPSFGFNGIGDLIPGQGYQVKMLFEVNEFKFVYSDEERIELTPMVPQWATDMPIEMHPNDIRSLVRVVNMLGQEVNPEYVPRGTTLLYLFNDGTVEKKISQ